MEICLSIILDKEGKRKKDLYKTSSLQEMDSYMQKYENSEHVRKEYYKEIDEFLKYNKKYLESLEADALSNNKKPRKNRGRIHVCFYGKDNKLRYVPAIYKGMGIIKRVNIIKLRKSLLDDKIFAKVIKKYDYLFGNSQYAKETISLYNRMKYDRYKKILVDLLIENIKNSSKEGRYYYFRTLMNTCNLIENKPIKTMYGTINYYAIPYEQVKVRKDDMVPSIADDFMMQLIDCGDYEELFNLYSVDDIIKYNDDRDNPIGLRRK